jgi:fatty-acyl-CoA synthase
MEFLAVDSTIQGPALEDEMLGALTLGGFFHEVCATHAEREALVFHAPSGLVIRRRYREIWDEALMVARVLAARGVSKGTRVGVLATNRPEWVTAAFGVALAGGTCVALNTFATNPELEHQLRIGDVSVLIFERSVAQRDFATELLQLCPELETAEHELRSARLPFLRRVVCIGETADLSAAFEPWPDFLDSDAVSAAIIEARAAEIDPTDPGLVFFSSGSTAKPKAILHTQRAAALQCWRSCRNNGSDRDVRTWTANGFFWSGNFAIALGGTFAIGGCLVLQRIFNPAEALRLMQEERISLPLAWPHQWARLADDPAYAAADLSSLRYVGETSPLRLHPTVKCDWQEPVSAYGSTETLTLSTTYPSGTPASLCAGNHGVPLPGNTVRIVDPLTGRVLPRGESGEIAVKGPTLMLGYLRVAPETVFDAEGFFRTGDGGFVDEQGRLHWHGRLNDIIKTGGANVSPVEIDAVLAECPGVKVAATIGIPHATLGEIVVACIVRDDDTALQESAVLAYAAKRLSSYKVPRRVLFVAESDLTLTGSNKVKKGPLRDLAIRYLAEA